MKRTIAKLLFILTIISSLIVTAGCSQNDPLEIWKRAEKNLVDAHDVSIRGKVQSSVRNKGMFDLSMSMHMDITEIYIKGSEKGVLDDQLFLHMITRYSDPAGEANEETRQLLAETVNQKVYMKEGILYVNDGTVKMKADLKKEFGRNVVDAVFKEIEDIKQEDYVISAKKNGDVVTLTLDAEKASLDFLKIAVEMFATGEMSKKEQKEITDNAEKALKAAGIKTITLAAVIEDDNFTSMTATLNAKVNLPAIMTILMGSAMNEDEDEITSSGKSDYGFETGSLFGIGKSDKDVLSLGTGEANMMDINVVADLTDIKVNKGAKIKYPNLTKYKTGEEIEEEFE